MLTRTGLVSPQRCASSGPRPVPDRPPLQGFTRSSLRSTSVTRASRRRCCTASSSSRRDTKRRSPAPDARRWRRSRRSDRGTPTIADGARWRGARCGRTSRAGSPRPQPRTTTATTAARTSSDGPQPRRRRPHPRGAARLGLKKYENAWISVRIPTRRARWVPPGLIQLRPAVSLQTKNFFNQRLQG